MNRFRMERRFYALGALLIAIYWLLQYYHADILLGMFVGGIIGRLCADEAIMREYLR